MKVLFIVTCWLVLMKLPLVVYTSVGDFNNHPIQILNFTGEAKTSFTSRCSLFQKYSNFSTILLSSLNCQSLLTLVVRALKFCNHSTDTIHLAVVLNECDPKGNSQNCNSSSKETCKCLFSENGSFFINRGVAFDVQSGGIHVHANRFCKVIPDDYNFWMNYSVDLIMGNQFSTKDWNQLRNVQEILLPTRNITSNAIKAAEIEIQEFPTSVICLHLGKNCKKPTTKANSNTSGIKSLIQGGLNVLVHVLPKSEHPWEIELSPAVYFDQLIFTMTKQWKHNENVKFVKSFRLDSWILMVAIIFIMAGILLLLVCIKNKINSGRYYLDISSIQLVCFSLVVSLLEQPTLTKALARNIEEYMILGFWFLVLTSLTNVYKSKLVENLVRRDQISLPSNIDELLNSSAEFRISHNLMQGMAQAVKGIGGAKVNETILRSEMVQTSNSSSILDQYQMACLVYTLVDNFACLTLENINKLDATMLSTTLGLTNGSINRIWHFSERSTGIYTMWGYRRGFLLKEKFNDALGRIYQAGLQMKWFKTVLSLKKWFRNDKINISTIFPKNVSSEYQIKLQKYIRENKQRLPDSELLVMKHIQPVFNLCFFVMCFSLFIFLLELIIPHKSYSTPKTTQGSRLPNNIEIKIIVSHYYTLKSN